MAIARLEPPRSATPKSDGERVLPTHTSVTNDPLDQFATGSHEVLQYVGLCGDGRLAHALHPT